MCGIAGAIGVPHAALLVRLMLQKLQHRGPEAAGIVSLDLSGEEPVMHEHRALGWVIEAFRGIDVATALPGDMAIGHVRYATAGDTEPNLGDAQPLTASIDGAMHALVHNGNLTNMATLRDGMEQAGAIFATTSDSELFLHLLARTDRRQDAQIRLHHATRQAEGAYTLLLLSPEGLQAAIDPQGFRPLVMCRYKGGILLASEESAFRPFPEATEIRHMSPNSLWWRKLDGSSEQLFPLPMHVPGRACSFETLYFSKPESELPDGRSVQTMRERMGRALAAKESLVRAPDVVTAVPDSSNAMAMAYAACLGVPHEIALIRSHDTGRTFLRPKPADREQGVRMKYGVVRDKVRGKRVTVVDDSIVRGTTIRRVIKLLREAGAAEVHVRIGSPRVVHPCYWGMDTPNFRELIAAVVTNEAIRADIGADSLEYLTIGEFLSALDDPAGARHCFTCFSGEPPVADQLVPKERITKRRR